MSLSQTARKLAVLPLLALAITVGVFVGAPDQVSSNLRDWAAAWQSKATAQVYGCVTRNGKPVPHVEVQFQTSNGQFVSTTTDAEGNYAVTLPEGNATIYVHPPREGKTQMIAEASLMEDGSIHTSTNVSKPVVVQSGHQKLNVILEK